jgi:hypothetical protein
MEKLTKTPSYVWSVLREYWGLWAVYGVATILLLVIVVWLCLAHTGIGQGLSIVLYILLAGILVSAIGLAWMLWEQLPLVDAEIAGLRFTEAVLMDLFGSEQYHEPSVYSALYSSLLRVMSAAPLGDFHPLLEKLGNDSIYSFRQYCESVQLSEGKTEGTEAVMQLLDALLNERASENGLT